MRTILLELGDNKKSRIKVPDDAKITFGPWSPPNQKGYGYDPKGTLRIYKGTKDNILACFSNVVGFRDVSVDYEEQIAKEEGATMWKSDQNGYFREDRIDRKTEWVNPQLSTGKSKSKSRRK